MLCAMSGHWIANAALDRDQYGRAGLEYTWRASLPILIQTILVMLVVVLVGPLSMRRGPIKRSRSATRPVTRRRLLTLLVTSQLLLFLLMEVSERIVQREPFRDGLLASGFIFELLFAIGSALLLAVLGCAAVHVIRSTRRQPRAATIEDRVDLIPQHTPLARPLIVVGDVRAPPLVPA